MGEVLPKKQRSSPWTPIESEDRPESLHWYGKWSGAAQWHRRECGEEVWRMLLRRWADRLHTNPHRQGSRRWFDTPIHELVSGFLCCIFPEAADRTWAFLRQRFPDKARRVYLVPVDCPVLSITQVMIAPTHIDKTK